MPTYFVPFQQTDIIGVISAVLGGLYTYAISLILNFAIQHTKHSDLHLRIAVTDGIVNLVKEILISSSRSSHTRAAILIMILLFTLAGKSFSYIVTSGIKASTGTHLGTLETVETRLGSSTLSLPNRGTNLTVLQAIYNFQKKSVDKTVNFEVLANSTPIRVAKVIASSTGGAYGIGTPGTFSIIRQMFKFTFTEESPRCELTSHCKLRMVNTTLDNDKVSLGEMLDTSFNFVYVGSNDMSRVFGLSPPVLVGTMVFEAIEYHSR